MLFVCFFVGGATACCALENSVHLLPAPVCTYVHIYHSQKWMFKENSTLGEVCQPCNRAA